MFEIFSGCGYERGFLDSKFESFQTQLRGSTAALAVVHTEGVLVFGGTHPQPHNEDPGLVFQRTELSRSFVDRDTIAMQYGGL